MGSPRALSGTPANEAVSRRTKRPFSDATFGIQTQKRYACDAPVLRILALSRWPGAGILHWERCRADSPQITTVRSCLTLVRRVVVGEFLVPSAVWDSSPGAELVVLHSSIR